MANVEIRQLRIFGYGFFVILTVLGGFSLWKHHDAAGAALLVSGFAFGILGLFVPLRLLAVYRPWMKFAEMLGWFNTRLLLAVAYYLVLTPMGVLMRLIGKDPMARWIKRESYWVVPPEHSRGSKHFERQF
jgi:saxitoxin biosynthesis operon SxtJ-like protein